MCGQTAPAAPATLALWRQVSTSSGVGGDGGGDPVADLPPGLRQQRLRRLQDILGCDPAAADALAREHPVLLLLGPYALRRLAASSLERGFSAGPGAKAGAAATSQLLLEVAVDAPTTLQMRAMHWGERRRRGRLRAPRALGAGTVERRRRRAPHVTPRVSSSSNNVRRARAPPCAPQACA